MLFLYIYYEVSEWSVNGQWMVSEFTDGSLDRIR